MSDRREEGPLGDRHQQNARQRAEAEQRRRDRDRLTILLKTPAFVEWIGAHTVPYLLGDKATTNGGDLQHFMGERQHALFLLRDFEQIAPGFTERVLSTRRTLLEEVRNISTPADAPQGE